MSECDGGLDERGRRFLQRLEAHPEVHERFEALLAMIENADGDTLTADDAEQRVVEELQQLGREALQGWAQRKATRLEDEYDGRRDYQRKEKKSSPGKPEMVR